MVDFAAVADAESTGCEESDRPSRLTHCNSSHTFSRKLIVLGGLPVTNQFLKDFHGSAVVPHAPSGAATARVHARKGVPVTKATRLAVLVCVAVATLIGARLSLVAESRAAASRALDEAPKRELTQLEFLRDYWGAKWPELESRLSETSRSKLAVTLVVEPTLNWKEAAPPARARLREALQQKRATWESSLGVDKDMDLSAETSSPALQLLSIEHREAVAAVVRKYAVDIERLVALSFDLTVEANEAIWETDRCVAQPYVSFEQSPQRPCTGSLVMIQKCVQHPWIVNYTIDSAEWPQLEAVLGQLTELRAQRAAAIREHLSHG